jgi:hypothetical protein
VVSRDQQDSTGWIVVEAEGRGRTAMDARKAAILAALRKIAGEYLVENTVVEDGQITDDSLWSFTTQKGYDSEDLEGFPIIENDGAWHAKMKIRVIARDFKQLVNRFKPRAVTGQVTVEAEGIGETASDAERNAIANGVRQIVGAYIEAEVVIDNKRVVSELITSYTTSQNITSERIGNYRAVGDEVAVTMRVTTALEPLYAMFRERSTSATVIDGDVLAAELDLARDNIVAKTQILENLLKELPTRLLIARLIGRDGEPIENGRPSADDMKPILGTDEIAFALNVQCYFDLKTFYTRVAPALARALDAMATRPSKPMSIEEDRVHGRKVLFTREPVKRGPDHASWTYESTTPPDKCQVILPRGRNKDGTQRDADLYILPKDLFPAFKNVVQYDPATGYLGRSLFLMVFVEFLDHDGNVIRTEQFNPAYGILGGQTVFGEDLPVRAEFTSINGLNPYSSFNNHWHHSGVDTVMINPWFEHEGGSFVDSTVWRGEFRMLQSTFEQLDRIALSAQLYEFYKPGSSRRPPSGVPQTYRGKTTQPVNEDLDPIPLGWKGVDGKPINPGGTFRRPSLRGIFPGLRGAEG